MCAKAKYLYCSIIAIQKLLQDSNLNNFFQVHEYLRSKLCSLYENDCIFDKFECCWNGNDTAIMTGSYNNFFRMFDRSSRKEVTYEASKEIAKPKTILKPRKVRFFDFFMTWCEEKFCAHFISSSCIVRAYFFRQTIMAMWGSMRSLKSQGGRLWSLQSNLRK